MSSFGPKIDTLILSRDKSRKTIAGLRFLLQSRLQTLRDIIAFGKPRSTYRSWRKFSVEQLEARAMMAVLNELKVNPPGSATGSNKYQYIEIAGSAGETLTNQYLLMLDGNGTAAGSANYVANLNGKVLGSNGLLMIKSPTGGHTAGTGTTVVTDTQFDNASGILSKNTVSFFLVTASAPVVQGTDYDTNNDGVLDNLPAGFEIVDTVGWSDGDAGDKVYGSVSLTQTQGTPDAASRIVGNNSTATSAWYNGDLYDAGNDATQLLYDKDRGSSNLPIDPFIASITPGATNFVQSATTKALRMVSYNVTSSSNSGVPRTGMNTLLQAFGSEVVAAIARPIDLISMQEVLSQATTGASVAGLLNTLYGAGTYAASALNGGSTGAGTQGFVYNTRTLTLLSETAIGTPSSSGQPRQTVRGRFRPAGTTGSSDFYVYNGHWKSADTGADEARRLVEAQAIRADADALGQSANILYVGDFNIYRGTDNAFEALLAAGNGQAFDPINRIGSWHGNAAYKDIMTQAPAVAPASGLTGGGLDDRFDWQAVSGELLDGLGLDYRTGSYRTFGNNGSAPLNGNINDAASTALLGLANRTTVLDLLTTVSDHLPVIADFTYTIGSPTNQAPSGSDKTVTTTEDNPYTFTASDFGFSDTDSNTLLAVKVATIPTSGSLQLNSATVTAGQFIAVSDITAGNFKFVPAANANGSPYATWTFQVQDNGGTASGGVDLDPTPNTITVNVTAVNDAPTLTTTSGSTAYVGAGAVIVDTGVSIGDIDNLNLVGATASITGNFFSAQDSLAFVNANGITGSYNSSSGVLTLSGSASLANYQLALRSITYNNASGTPNTATRTVRFQVNDGSAANNLSNIATRTVTINANVAPVVTTSSGAVTFIGSALPIDSGLTISDADSATLSGATVSITTGFVGGQDVLAIPTNPAVSGVYNSSTGVLTLTGVTTVANYQAALRTVTYNNTSGSPNTTTRIVSFVVNDGATINNLSNAATKSVAVSTASNSPVFVSTRTVTPTGVDVVFNRPINASLINLYDQGGTLGAADVTLVGANSGPVRGSVVFNSTNTGFTFIKTGSLTAGSGQFSGTLDPDSYTLTLRSNATNGFADTAGNPLRDSSGTVAGDYVFTFTVAAPPSNSLTFSIPDFARGYSQAVNVPNTATGLPVVISNGNNVSGVDFRLSYDPALLSITGFSTTIPGATAVVNLSTPGIANIQVYTTTSFATVDGAMVVGSFIATVPDTAPYAAKQVLRLSNVQAADATPDLNSIPTIADNGVEITAFFGDTNGDKAYSSADSTLLARAGVGTNSGFVAYQLADPFISADLNNSFGLSSADTTILARQAVGTNQSAIPALPVGVTPPTATGLDPKLFIPRNLRSIDVDAAIPGIQVDIPVDIDVTDASGITISGFDLAIGYDATKLKIASTGAAKIGALLEPSSGNLAGTSFAIAYSVPTPGILRLMASTSEGTHVLPFGLTGSIVVLRATLAEDASGTTVINLLATAGGTATAIADNNVSSLVLIPAPTNSNTDSVDGLLTIEATARNRPISAFTNYAPKLSEDVIRQASRVQQDHVLGMSKASNLVGVTSSIEAARIANTDSFYSLFDNFNGYRVSQRNVKVSDSTSDVAGPIINHIPDLVDVLALSAHFNKRRRN